LEQSEKALAAILVTESGIVIVVKPEPYWNALAAILVMVEPIVTLAKLVRFAPVASWSPPQYDGTAPA
jgi:hypothetical protein